MSAALNPSLLDVRIEFPTRLVIVTGELDIATSALLADAVQELQRAGTGDIALDLRDVTFIDSTALGVLVQARNDQEAASMALHIRAASDQVQRVLKITGLTAVFPCATVASAI